MAAKGIVRIKQLLVLTFMPEQASCTRYLLEAGRLEIAKHP